MKPEVQANILNENQMLQDSSIKLKLASELIAQVTVEDRMMDARIYNILVLLNDIRNAIDERYNFLSDQLKNI